MPKLRHPDRLPRDMRKQQIEDWFKRNEQREPGYVASCQDVARAIKVGKSSHLNDMLFELVEDGTLKAFPSRWINGWSMWLFAYKTSPYEQLELSFDTSD